jgi:SSS family solute:Na+ symporter
MGIMVGLYMQRTQPDLESALALPTFILEQLPAAFAGVAFATLLIAAVGTASGLALGVATTLKVDIVNKTGFNIGNHLMQMRLLTLFVVLMAFVLLLFNLGTTIMHWSFLSMGLRGAAICFPLLFAVFFKERTSYRAGVLSTCVAPSVVLFCGFVGAGGVPPLSLGLSCSFLILAVGLGLKWRRENPPASL